jgi:biotin operon repressor
LGLDRAYNPVTHAGILWLPAPTLKASPTKGDNMSGWIKLHRRLLEWEWYNDHNTFRLYIHILLKANYETKGWRGIVIERGQLVTSIPSLVKETGLSAQSVRTSLNRLKSTGELTDKVTNKFRLLTVVKYEEYQSEDYKLTDKVTDKPTGQQQATNRQLTATKEYKNKRNKEENTPPTPFGGVNEIEMTKVKELRERYKSMGLGV